MNDLIVFAGILGLTIGMCGGYFFRQMQDSKFLRDLNAIHDEHVEMLKTESRRRELLYQGEINRLHCLIAEKSKGTSMSDLVKAALERDGFEELDFPNGGKK